MRIISLHQPWATLCVMGLKRLETRGMRTNHRGLLLIHAAKAHNPIGKAVLNQARRRGFLPPDFPPFSTLPRGGIIGRVTVIGIHPSSHLRAFFETVEKGEQLKASRIFPDIARLVTDEHTREEFFGDYDPGRWAWMLADPRQFIQMIPLKGQQGMWNFLGELPELIDIKPAGAEPGAAENESA
jgi:hypothetical protein